MSWLWLSVNHKCPYCNSENHLLKYYVADNMNSFIEVGDYVPNNLDSDVGFITADGCCDYCEKSYVCKVGIKKSRLTNVIIFDKEVKIGRM